MRTHNPQYARSEYHTQLANMSFDKIFDLTAGVYFYYYNNSTSTNKQLQNISTDPKFVELTPDVLKIYIYIFINI